MIDLGSLMGNDWLMDGYLIVYGSWRSGMANNVSTTLNDGWWLWIVLNHDCMMMNGGEWWLVIVNSDYSTVNDGSWRSGMGSIPVNDSHDGD